MPLQADILSLASAINTDPPEVPLEEGSDYVRPRVQWSLFVGQRHPCLVALGDVARSLGGAIESGRVQRRAVVAILADIARPAQSVRRWRGRHAAAALTVAEAWCAGVAGEADVTDASAAVRRAMATGSVYHGPHSAPYEDEEHGIWAASACIGAIGAAGEWLRHHIAACVEMTACAAAVRSGARHMGDDSIASREVRIATIESGTAALRRILPRDQAEG